MKRLLLLILVLYTNLGITGSVIEEPRLFGLETKEVFSKSDEKLSGSSCLSVIFSPNAIICGTTTITAEVNCNFDGVVQLHASSLSNNIEIPTGDIVIINGVFQFDVTVSEGAQSFVDIITTVVATWNDPDACVLETVCEPSTLVTLCAIPENDICEEAMPIDVSLNQCAYEAYSNNLWGPSGISGDCGSSADNDMFFRFEAISEELHVLFGELPSNSMTFELFSSCEGEVIYCLSMGSYTNIVIDDLTEGNDYIIRLSDLQGDNEGLIEMCIWSSFVCDLTAGISLIQDESCFGTCDAIAQVTAEFGTAPYNYSWSNNFNQASTYNLCPGTHYVTVTDDNGCTLVDSIFIEATLEVIANAGEDIDLCQENSVQINGAGGNTYNWSPSLGLSDSLIADPIANPTETTTYILTVEGEPGCMDQDTMTIFVHNNPETEIMGDTLACSGDSLLLSAIGSSLQYVWNTTDSTQQIQITNSGEYIVTASDSIGCIVSDTILVNYLPPINVDYEIQHESGNDFANGSIQTAVSGGLTPYYYSWNLGDTIGHIDNLTGGTYSLDIVDSFGCTFSDTIAIDSFVCSPITIQSAFTPLVCVESCNGSIQINQITNHSGPVSYNWSNGSSIDSITQLCEGIYTVMVTDSLNCSATDTFQIQNAPAIEIIIDEIRHYRPEQRGLIKLDLDGPYSVAWSGPDGFQAFTESIYGLGEGCYELLVVDTLTQCTADTTICIDNLTTEVFDLADKAKEFNMYPNPARDHLTLEWLNDSATEIKLQVLGMDGKVLQTAYKPADERIIIVPLEQLENGVYFIKILSDRKQFIRRFIIAE